MGLAELSGTKHQDKEVLLRVLILSALLCLANTLNLTQLAIAHSQQTQPQSRSSSAKTGTGVISGKVTINGKRASGIQVVLRAAESPAAVVPPRTVTTDEDGNYQITKVLAGTYNVAPVAPALVDSNASSSFGWIGLRGKPVIIADGETVQHIDFVLVRGGVITGRVVDSEGRPLIEQPINVALASENNKFGQSVLTRAFYTDDRGIYRIFGLPGDKYLVSVGRRTGGFFAGAARLVEYRQTFHPSATDSAKATIVEVTEGSEATNVDITVNLDPSVGTFSISGTVVDEKTGQTVPNVGLGLKSNEVAMTSIDWGSNNSGEFKFQNLTPGVYSIYVEPQFNNGVEGEPISVEIINQDLQGLMLKTRRSASISGVVAFESADSRPYRAELGKLQLGAFVLTEATDGGRTRTVSINPDAGFRVGGLPAGRAFFTIISNEGKGYRIMRVEREGMVQYRGMEVNDGEVITGVRLVVRVGSGSVRGVVKAEGGDLPLPPRLALWLSVPGEEGINPFAAMSQPQVDSRGFFIIDKLPSGDYEVNASVFTPRGRISTKQPVHISDGSVSKVTLTLKFNSAPVP